MLPTVKTHGQPLLASRLILLVSDPQNTLAKRDDINEFMRLSILSSLLFAILRRLEALNLHLS